MKNWILTSVLGLAFSCSASAQDFARYYELTGAGYRLFFEGNYLAAGAKFNEAFRANGGKGKTDDRYNASRAWARAGQGDSAFFHLEKIADEGNFNDIQETVDDTALTSLHADPRWDSTISKFKVNKEKQEANFDRQLVAMLDTIFNNDQSGRKETDDVKKKYGRDSQEMQAHWKEINKTDSINLIHVRKILDERGWLGPEIVGEQGNLTLFLVIQHANLATQEKYLPMLREATQKGKADKEGLALMEDRVALGQGKKQIYGSQIGVKPGSDEYYLRPMIDPDHVDRRRNEMEMSPIQDYLDIWGIRWDVEEYKRKLPEYEAWDRQ